MDKLSKQIEDKLILVTDHIILEKAMSKFNALWEFVKKNDSQSLKLTFDEIKEITGIPIDHSFLTYKKELVEYGYQVGKISIKDQTVIFNKI